LALPPLSSNAADAQQLQIPQLYDPPMTDDLLGVNEWQEGQ